MMTMTQTALGAVLDRLAAITGALRIRHIDRERLELNGGTTSELEQRVAELVVQLERVADELEAAL